MNKFIKNFSYTLTSNIVSFLISAFITFIIPKKLGVQDYGYFQLYLFYANYTGFLHLGWADGIYLRYGGGYYEKLDKAVFSGQFRLYCTIETVLSIVIAGLGFTFAPDHEMSLVLLMVGISVIVSLSRTLWQYILQGTNRIKEYAIMTVTEKIAYVFIIVVSLVAGLKNFIPIIAADLIGKFCAFLYGSYQCRDTVFCRPVKLDEQINEAFKNISVGIKIMFANVASMLILGIVRQAIEWHWDVEVFGKISLTMSISNMLMILIRAVSMLMFPMLRRIHMEKLPELYQKLRVCLMVPLLGMLIFYYPFKVIISAWLPQYVDGLIYMAMLFPVCIYESKTSMLIETYMKALRMEQQLMVTNFITVGTSFVTTVLTVYVFDDLDLAVISIVFLMAFRCIIAEKMLLEKIRISVDKDIILGIVLTVSFIISSWFIGGINGVLIYLVLYILYLMIKKNELIETMRFIKRSRKSV